MKGPGSALIDSDITQTKRHHRHQNSKHVRPLYPRAVRSICSSVHTIFVLGALKRLGEFPTILACSLSTSWDTVFGNVGEL